jgi:hypothetical protein
MGDVRCNKEKLTARLGDPVNQAQEFNDVLRVKMFEYMGGDIALVPLHCRLEVVENIGLDDIQPGGSRLLNQTFIHFNTDGIYVGLPKHLHCKTMAHATSRTFDCAGNKSIKGAKVARAVDSVRSLGICIVRNGRCLSKEATGYDY